MYGRAVQIDEINKIVTENIQKYLTDEKIEILGDPLARPDDSENIDFDSRNHLPFLSTWVLPRYSRPSSARRTR
jgi:trigger factor